MNHESGRTPRGKLAIINAVPLSRAFAKASAEPLGRIMKNGRIIPPLSVVRLVCADKHTPQWKDQIGRTFRIGYYSRQDGTDCVWLVNDAGEYEQTVDQAALDQYFVVVERSKERAIFGQQRPPIPALEGV